jgi:hypothetical protein
VSDLLNGDHGRHEESGQSESDDNSTGDEHCKRG